MKTLDETIDNIETCQKHSICISCPYYGFNECKSKWGRDALHYLKEYRLVQENYADALAEKYPSENVSLTCDELK